MKSDAATEEEAIDHGWSLKGKVVAFGLLTLGMTGFARISDSIRPPYMDWQGHLVAGLIISLGISFVLWRAFR